ncbi:MAG: hypothetical protein R2694_10170 [Ilumatobacteraceae bacterium]
MFSTVTVSVCTSSATTRSVRPRTTAYTFGRPSTSGSSSTRSAE